MLSTTKGYDCIFIKVKNIDSNSCTVINRFFFGFGVGTRRVQKMSLIDSFEKVYLL